MAHYGRFGVALLVLLLAAGGCARGLPSQERVEEALLKPEDLPDGWEVDEDIGEIATFAGECQLQEHLDDANPDVETREVYASSDENQVVTIHQLIVGYDERATEVFEEVPENIEDCDEPELEIFDEFAVSEVHFEDLGQASHAWRLRRQGYLINSDAALVVWRDGHLIQALTYNLVLIGDAERPDSSPLQVLEGVAESATERMP